MPESIQNRVFHRSELPNTFVDEIRDKQNILIIMDEIQVAAKKGQTIYKTFKNAGILNKSTLYEKDVKILEYTATPDGTIYDLMKWNDASNKILADIGDGYISSYNLLQMGRVRQYAELSGYNKETNTIDAQVINNIRDIRREIDNFKTPLYHIIRTKNGLEQAVTIDNFKKVFDTEVYQFINYDRESEIDDINKTLAIPPGKHTFIFIKEMLRCAKTLKKSYIGILYDRYTKNPDDTTIIQGLSGRDTGYDNNGISICYTNINSIERYNALWESDFEDKTINWNSKTTKYTNGILYGKNTFNDPKDYDGFSVISDDTNEEIKEPVIKKFKSQQESITYLRELRNPNNNIRGPRIRKANKDGFFETIIRSIKRVYSCNEISDERKHGLTESNFRLYPCYKDVRNKSTLEWWVIHY
jgi:hypothetical protein